MEEVLRFRAPGPWITRDLKYCVLASDFDRVVADNCELHRIASEAIAATTGVNMRNTELVAERDEAVRARDEVNDLMLDVKSDNDALRAEMQALRAENARLVGLVERAKEILFDQGYNESQLMSAPSEATWLRAALAPRGDGDKRAVRAGGAE